MYDIQLFQLCVPTNVGFFVVGTFITEEENVSSISEGLRQIKDNSPEWHQQSFMVDNDAKEIAALQTLFPSE